MMCGSIAIKIPSSFNFTLLKICDKLFPCNIVLAINVLNFFVFILAYFGLLIFFLKNIAFL